MTLYSPKIIFGAEHLDASVADEHFLIVGATGSGKTVIVRMLMKSVLEGPGWYQPRALIYDPKREFLPLLYAIDREEDCKILNPFDRRCAGWEVAKDFSDPVSIRQFASTLVPERVSNQENSSFFDNATRDILTAVMLTLSRVAIPGSWEFRDVLLGALYLPYLKFLLSHDVGRNDEFLGLNARVREIYLGGEPRTRDNILATVQARLGVFEPIGAIWAEAFRSKDPMRRFSLNDWSKSQEILILGNEELGRTSIDAINRAIFLRTSEVLLDLPSRDQTPLAERTWIILDELREAGKIDGIGRLLNKGRSSGITLALAFQDIEGMRDLYGTHLAHEIMGQCGTIVILRLSSPETAKWSASLFGEYLALETIDDPTIGQGQVSMSRKTQLIERKNVYSTELLYLPKTSVTNGLTGFYKHAAQTVNPQTCKQIDWNTQIAPYLAARANVETFLPHESTDTFFLTPWTEEDWIRLGFTGALPNYAEEGSEDGASLPDEPIEPDSLLNN